jgi:hypothetical protein
MLPSNLPASLLQLQHPSIPNYSHSSHLAPVHLRSQAANQNESPPLYQAPAETAEQQHTIHPTFPHSPAQQKATLTKDHPQVSWGDPHTFPHTTHLRIVFQNCNTLSKDHFTRFSYLNRLKLLKPHIFGLAETNLNWSYLIWITCVGFLMSTRECMSVFRNKSTCRRHMTFVHHTYYCIPKTITDTEYWYICSTNRHRSRSLWWDWMKEE